MSSNDDWREWIFDREDPNSKSRLKITRTWLNKMIDAVFPMFPEDGSVFYYGCPVRPSYASTIKRSDFNIFNWYLIQIPLMVIDLILHLHIFNLQRIRDMKVLTGEDYDDELDVYYPRIWIRTNRTQVTLMKHLACVILENVQYFWSITFRNGYYETTIGYHAVKITRLIVSFIEALPYNIIRLYQFPMSRIRRIYGWYHTLHPQKVEPMQVRILLGIIVIMVLANIGWVVYKQIDSIGKPKVEDVLVDLQKSQSELQQVVTVNKELNATIRAQEDEKKRLEIINKNMEIALTNLRKKKETIQKETEKKVADIKKSDLPKTVKEKEISKARIQSVWDTYKYVKEIGAVKKQLKDKPQYQDIFNRLFSSG